MSTRLLTAYLVSVGLAAGIISQALAKPPDLPAKVQINCEKCSDKLVLKTYQVADLVIPVESAPGLDEVFQTPVSARPEAVPGPAPVLAHPPEEVFPQPFGFVTLPVPFEAAPYYPVPIPVMPTPVFGLVKAFPTQTPKACCPACASVNCNGCGADAPCQAAACVASGCASAQVHTPQKTLEDRLIRLIVSTVKPESWDANGGRGTIDYFPLGMALTVNQTAEVQEQVAQLLAALRRLQDEQIAVEVRFISVPQGFGDKIANKCANCCGHCPDLPHSLQKICSGSITIGASLSSDAGLTGSISLKESAPHSDCCSKDEVCCFDPGTLKFLSDAQVQKYMDSLQANPKTNIMMAPKLTVFNGQTANVHVTEQTNVVTSLKAIRQGDHQVFIPQSEPLTTGLSFSVKPTYSADHRFIRMEFEAEQKSLNAPDCENGPPVALQAIPAGEVVQLQTIPTAVIVQRIHNTVCVPCGQTVLFKTWSQCARVLEECGLPILSCLPYVGDMFKTVGYHEEAADVWIMITARLLTSQEEEIRPPIAAASPTVTDNLQKLQQARVLLDQADHCRRMGQPESARHIYERVRKLCPGSRYAQMAGRRLQLIQAHPVPPSPEAPLQTSENGPPVIPGGSFSGGQWIWTGQAKTEEGSRVQDCMERYWQACAEGRLAEATQWAVQALAFDPACFSKARAASWKKSPQPAVMPSAN